MVSMATIPNEMVINSDILPPRPQPHHRGLLLRHIRMPVCCLQVFYLSHCVCVPLFMLFAIAHFPPIAVYAVAGAHQGGL